MAQPAGAHPLTCCGAAHQQQSIGFTPSHLGLFTPVADYTLCLMTVWRLVPFSASALSCSLRTLEWSCFWDVCWTSSVSWYQADTADCEFKTNNQKKKKKMFCQGKYLDFGPYLTWGNFEVVVSVLRSFFSICNLNVSLDVHFSPSLLGVGYCKIHLRLQLLQTQYIQHSMCIILDGLFQVLRHKFA